MMDETEINDAPEILTPPDAAIDVTLSDEQFLAQSAPEVVQPQQNDDEGGAQGSSTDEPQEEASAAPIDYKEFYRRIAGQPIAANGKTIEIRDADEAVRLMQMGANYTRKMQELAPQRKMLAMLREHELLDEGTKA